MNTRGSPAPQEAIVQLETAIRAVAGLKLVEKSEFPDLRVEAQITDEPGCVHCPQTRNYWAWSLIFLEPTDRPVAVVGGRGWKLLTSLRRSLIRAVEDLRKCSSGA